MVVNWYGESKDLNPDQKEHDPMAHDAEITAKHLDDYPFQRGI